MTDEIVNLTVDQAIELLPDDEEIHTMYNLPGILLGVDRKRKSIIESLRESKEIQLSGPNANKMGYGIAFIEAVTNDWLFIKTGKINEEKRKPTEETP